MDYLGLKIDHFEHDTFRIKAGKTVIYIDPYNLKENQIEPADFIFITHEHFDHCSEKDVKKIANPGASIIASESCSQEQRFLAHFGIKSLIYMSPGDTGEFDAIKVWARPAYNLDKTFHKRGDGQVGYVIEINKVRIYHAGDTDNIPEMADLKNIDLALLPVSGVYVMGWPEAVEAVKIIKPKIVIPMHYGSVVGSEDDARKFKEKADCRVEII